MLQILFYLFALFFIFCGVIVLFGFFGNLARAAETQACREISATCRPDRQQPPPCQMLCPDADTR